MTSRKAIARLALIALPIASVMGVATHAAVAQPKGGTAAKGCPVENSDGTTTTVEVGTRVGLFVCGEDGEWHFGWLIDGRAQPTKPTKPANVKAADASKRAVARR